MHRYAFWLLGKSLSGEQDSLWWALQMRCEHVICNLLQYDELAFKNFAASLQAVHGALMACKLMHASHQCSMVTHAALQGDAAFWPKVLDILSVSLPMPAHLCAAGWS